MVKPRTWSTKGLDFRAPLGTLKMWVRSSRMRVRCGAVPKWWENERMGREPRRQFPGKWSSDMVWTISWDGQLSFDLGSIEIPGSRTVLEMHLDGGAIRGLTHPDVEIFSFTSFEKEDVIAIVEFGQLVQLVEFGLCVQLCILATMREERI